MEKMHPIGSWCQREWLECLPQPKRGHFIVCSHFDAHFVCRRMHEGKSDMNPAEASR